MVMEVLNIQGIQRSLERLADLLSKVQKALGEYLERERASFPRFYFVGDEDLLEIIGNSKNIARLQRHFKKMFAGISSVILSEDGNDITGMTSAEGEEVIFAEAVSMVRNPRINDWLTEVESKMRHSLVKQLVQVRKTVTVNSPYENISMVTSRLWPKLKVCERARFRATETSFSHGAIASAHKSSSWPCKCSGLTTLRNVSQMEPTIRKKGK